MRRGRRRQAHRLAGRRVLLVLTAPGAGAGQLLQHCREEKIEPPAGERMGRIVGSALRQAEQALCLRISGRIPSAVVARLVALIEQAAMSTP